MLELNEIQFKALNMVLLGHNLLINGAAGTGKSYLIGEIVKRCESLGKKVSLTCTTGIACTVYDSSLNAKTLHRWSGIDDGRYSPSEIRTVVQNNAKYASVVNDIKHTDILIIDEISMLSKKMFECLNEVCSIKDESKAFGGMQLVLCGDFSQLPPVPNAMYNDEGRYCFECEFFSKVIPHTIVLSEVLRQRDNLFIKVLQEVSTGVLSQDSVDFVRHLDRPLHLEDDKDSVKLFATNDQVDDFNRQNLLKMSGSVYEFVSEDTGKTAYLNHVLAPHKLWLKVGAPVILLRNISDKLVNGLRGEVLNISEEGPFVAFHSVGIKVPIKKVKFTGNLLNNS